MIIAVMAISVETISVEEMVSAISVETISVEEMIVAMISAISVERISVEEMIVEMVSVEVISAISVEMISVEEMIVEMISVEVISVETSVEVAFFSLALNSVASFIEIFFLLLTSFFLIPLSTMICYDFLYFGHAYS